METFRKAKVVRLRFVNPVELYEETRNTELAHHYDDYKGSGMFLSKSLKQYMVASDDKKSVDLENDHNVAEKNKRWTVEYFYEERRLGDGRTTKREESFRLRSCFGLYLACSGSIKTKKLLVQRDCSSSRSSSRADAVHSDHWYAKNPLPKHPHYVIIYSAAFKSCSIEDGCKMQVKEEKFQNRFWWAVEVVEKRSDHIDKKKPRKNNRDGVANVVPPSILPPSEMGVGRSGGNFNWIFNSGGNSNSSGTQNNGDVKVWPTVVYSGGHTYIMYPRNSDDHSSTSTVASETKLESLSIAKK